MREIPGKVVGRRWTICLVVSLLLASVLLASGAAVSIKDVAGDPVRFNGQTVALRGTATAVKRTQSAKGNEYTTFRVKDSTGASVLVFSWGHPDVQEGAAVEVVGAFQRVRRVGHQSIYNEVRADTVRAIQR